MLSCCDDNVVANDDDDIVAAACDSKHKSNRQPRRGQWSSSKAASTAAQTWLFTPLTRLWLSLTFTSMRQTIRVWFLEADGRFVCLFVCRFRGSESKILKKRFLKKLTVDFFVFFENVQVNLYNCLNCYTKF